MTKTGAASALVDVLARPLVVFDVGCRWGFADSWLRLGAGCSIIGFDPDRDECRSLAGLYAEQPNVRVVPLGFGAREGPATLYVTRDPSCSSLYRPSPATRARFNALAVTEVVGAELIELATIDGWCEEEGMGGIDVLKVDTQGSELDVLKGAVRSLQMARAVQVEVEFNEIYEGQPLFGDVDRFLRAQGFVLWRLRDLAHYEPGESGSCHIALPDSADATALASRVERGQLLWANAVYLKSDSAAPDSSRAWDDLARDGAVASALGLHDLFTLAMEVARSVAPNGAIARLESALAEDGSSEHQRSCASEQARTESVLIDMAGLVDGGGWGAPHALGHGLTVRWTGPGRDAWMSLPLILGPGSRVEALVVASTSTANLENLAVDVNGHQVGLKPEAHDNGILYTGELPANYASARPYTRLMLRTAETVPWSDLHPESGDDRELGVAVAWIRLLA